MRVRERRVFLREIEDLRETVEQSARHKRRHAHSSRAFMHTTRRKPGGPVANPIVFESHESATHRSRAV